MVDAALMPAVQFPSPDASTTLVSDASLTPTVPPEPSALLSQNPVSNVISMATVVESPPSVSTTSAKSAS